jgi:hypothetical protein
LDKALLAAISKGAPYKIACLACGISEDAFTDWRRKDPGFARQVEEASGKMALRLLGKIEKQADENFSAAAWLLERRFVETFARPEVQLNLIQQNNTIVNALSISISPQEVREIEAQAEPVRQSVKALYAAYRPNQGNGNGEGQRTVDVTPSPVKRPEDLAPIVRKEGDEKSSAFWANFVSGTGERRVDKATAVFAVKVIVDEVCGAGRGNQAAFRTEPVAVEDVLSVIDRLCGGPAGWQLLQRKANFVASP